MTSKGQQESEYQNFLVTDGNTGVSKVAYMCSDLLFLFPITPATSMGEKADEDSSLGKKNVFDNVVKITQMQSEGGVAGALHGAILSGALAATFTCSQGLLLMIPEMYKLAGEMQPAVIHVAARAVAGQGLNIYCDHSDVYATKPTGWSLLASGSVQESVDMAVVAHLTTPQASIPILHFFDGFRVSHEIQKILFPSVELFKKLINFDSIMKWRESRTMRNNNASMRTLVENEDVYFPLLEATNGAYDALPALVQNVMDQYGDLTGRYYQLFQYYGDPNADFVVVAMGTATRTLEEYIEYAATLSSQKHKYGVIAVHLFKPFSIAHFVSAIPATCTHLTILDRCKEAGSTGEALYQECLSALYQGGRIAGLTVCAGRVCIGGTDITPSVAHAVYANMEDPKPRLRFTVGVRDDVTHLSLPLANPPVIITHPGVTEALFYGFGADGTVGSVKSAMDIIGGNTSLYSQAFFVYDAKKSGGVTMSHVRFGAAPIVSQYEIYAADYLACHHPTYIHKYEMLRKIKDKGVFVLNTPNIDVESLARVLPGQMKKALVEKELEFYVIDAEKIAANVGLRGRINMVMQTVFFYLSRVLPSIDVAVQLLKGSAAKTFKKKGPEVIAQNHSCIDQTIANLIRITPPKEWASSTPVIIPIFPPNTTPFFKEFCTPVLGLRGNDELKVSDLAPYVGGVFPTATTKYEKRNVSAMVPKWKAEDCVQCNMCSFVCAHSCIRPFLVQQDEYEAINKNTNTLQKVDLKGVDESKIGKEEKKLSFVISISTADCVGCGVCVSSCPKKCLTLVNNHTDSTVAEQKNYDALVTLPNAERAKLLWNPQEDWRRVVTPNANANASTNAAPASAPAPAPTLASAPAPAPTPAVPPKATFPITPPPSYKALSFKPPLLEYCAACGGCAESPLIRVLTQMFGERMVVTVSCGCSMVWGGSGPTCPYTVDKDGLGPAYAGSLFEDTAEYALGIATGGLHMRTQLIDFVVELRTLLQNAETPSAVLDQILGTDVDAGASSSSSSDADSSSSSSSSLPPEAAPVLDERIGLPQPARRTRLVALLDAWLAAVDDPYESKRIGQRIQRFFGKDGGMERPVAATVHTAEEPGLYTLQSLQLAPAISHRVVKEIWTRRDLLQRKSYWCLGGDGWAYDIGFGGLDHVLQLGLNLNILVMDTEVYSNTGGQRSKATPRAAVAKFAAGGKETRKKDLGFYAINIGSVYVATVAQGANPQQLVRALHEAEQFPGTSLVIALCPCINWSIKKGQGNAVEEEKAAVKSGYWPLYRYNPLSEYEEEMEVKGSPTPVKVTHHGVLTLDSPPPSQPLTSFIEGQNRFTALLAQTPAVGKKLQNDLQKDVLDSYDRLLKIAQRTNPKKA